MANLLTTDTELTQVANAIRTKGGTSSQLGFPTGMVNAIDAIAPTTQNIDAGNIKKGVVVKVGDPGNAGRYKNVTGNFTGDANAAAGDIRNGKTAYVNGNKVTGNWAPYVTTDTETSHDVAQAGFGSSGQIVIESQSAVLIDTIPFPSGYDMISSMNITGSSDITNSGYLKLACAVSSGTVYIFGCNVGSAHIKSSSSSWSYGGKVTFRKLKAV